jgi:gliding motility-associated protein GldC
MKTREIVLSVELDNQSLPEKLTWSASDGQALPTPCKAFLLAIWDEAEATSLRIDLWTKDMRVDEMNRLFHQTLLTMADTYGRATNDPLMAAELKEFGKAFGQKVGIKQ